MTLADCLSHLSLGSSQITAALGVLRALPDYDAVKDLLAVQCKLVRVHLT